MSTKKTLLICLGIIVIAAIITAVFFMTEPTAESESATRTSAMLVDYVVAEEGDFEPLISATGTVNPVEDVQVSPLVSGQIVRRAPGFTPGGFVKEGEVLLQIDPRDYRTNLDLSLSQLRQTETELEMEMGRQEVAEQDLALIGMDSLSSQQRSLVLRKPQLNAVQARIDAARAAVEQGRINLARTTIKAPFDAHVLTQNVTVGSQVSPGDNLGRLVGAEEYRVLLALPLDKLSHLKFPESDEELGSVVQIRDETSWPEGVFRIGYLDERIGAIDEETRLARVLVTVPDPLAREDDSSEKPPLIIGSFVDADITGEQIENVVRIDRNLVRRDNTVWVMADGKLSIRPVEIALIDDQYAYITEGLEGGDRVITTNLSTVSEGVEVRSQDSDSIPEETSAAQQETEE